MDFTPNPRTPPTVVTGSRGPENVYSNRVIVDIADEIAWYRPSANPLTTLSTRLRKKRAVTQRQFGWFTKDEYPRVIELSAASLVADTTLDVVAANATYSANQFMYRNARTEELVLVTSGGGTAALTVTRGFGGSTQADMEAGDKLTYISTVFPDGSGRGTAKSTKEVYDYNYCQIVKETYEVTGRQEHTDMYGGNDLDTERKAHAIEHAKSLEKVLFWGGRSTGTGSNGHEQTTAAGIRSYIQSNVWDLGGTRPTERSFVEALEEFMKEGKGGNLSAGQAKKFLFTPTRWTTEIEFFAKDKLRYSPEMTKLGLQSKEYLTTHGLLFIVPCHLLDEDAPDTAFLLDLNHIRFVYHQGRDTKIMRNTQNNDSDTHEEIIQSDISVEVTLEASHGIMKGLDLN